jgi:hypothetical protein
MSNNPLKNNINELQDGDHVLSPTLTNLYEGMHGNGILLTDDTAFAGSNRNNPANLGGAVAEGANPGVLTVKPFQAVLDGVLYDYGAGSDITVTLSSSSGDILDGSSVTDLTSGKECLFIVVATPLGVKFTQSVIITTAVGSYPSVSGTAAPYLDALEDSGAIALKNQQSTVIATIRATNSGGSTYGAGIEALSEINDHRTFIRTTPMYLTTVTNNSAGTSGVNDHETLRQIHGTGLYGDFGDAGVLWQSLNSDGETMMYYSRKDSSNRHTHLLGPTNMNVSSPSTNQTFTFDSDQVFVLTATATITLNPSGTFPPGHSVFVSVPSGSTVTFDSTGLNTAVAAGDAVMFAYDGSNWKKVLYSSTVATTSNGASGRVQFSDGAGGFNSDAALYFTAGSPDTLFVNGKLDVSGLIEDPTGLVLAEQSSDPGSTGAGEGTVWVKSDDPTRLYFTDDGSTDRKVVFSSDSVTELNDVSAAGSGSIITTSERTTVSGASSSTGILKSDGAGAVSAAVEDTDYQGVLSEGAFADGDKTKLDGIATGATANTGALADKDTVATADIDDDAVTYAKIQNVSTTNVLLGRDTAGAGIIEEISVSDVQTMLNIADGATAYDDDDAIDAVEGEGSLDLTGDVTVASAKTFLARRLPVVNLTGTPTITEANHAGRYLYGTVNATLPTPAAGVHYTFLNSGTGTVTISAGSGHNINDALSSVDIEAYNGATFIGISTTQWVALGV